MAFTADLFLAVLFPLIGAAIGWLTNRLAIRMLFRPRNPRKILGMRLQGLIPRRQGELALKVAQIVEEQLFEQHLIREEIRSMDLSPYLDELARKIVRERLAPKLRQIPLLGSFLNERILEHLEQMAGDAIRAETGQLLEEVSVEIEQRIAVRKRVEEKVRSFDLDHLEAVVRELAQKEFHHIEVLGAVIGFAIGCVQAGIMLFAIAMRG